MESLPVEIVQHIGKFLPGKSQPLLAVCSKTLYSYMSHEFLVWWRARGAYIGSMEYQAKRTNNIRMSSPIKPGYWWKDFIEGGCSGRLWKPIDYHTIILWRVCFGGPTFEPFDRELFDLAINEIVMTRAEWDMKVTGNLLHDHLEGRLQLTEEAGIVARLYQLW